MVVNVAFTNQTMLTCIGNKRKLVDDIIDFVEKIRKSLNKDKLNIFDGFTGSTVVARALSSIVSKLYVNDIELYSYLMSKCYLEKPSDENQELIKFHIDNMNNLAVNGPYIEDGIISTHYAPVDTENIQEGERCFYTRENAVIIDTLRNYISSEVEEDLQVYCLVPLLNRASIHTNTAGVFKGFYKDSVGIGKFGGQGENALTRIMSPIKVDMPIWNTANEYECFCYNEDINNLVKKLDNDLDVIYLDPPYNQHPYGSNYFMLNLIAENKVPENISSVSGIPPNWKRSTYNKNDDSKESMKELINESLKKSKYVLLSYNDEGFIKENDWNEILSGYTIEKKEITYDTYKGSRNLKNRSDKVLEIMYLISLPSHQKLSVLDSNPALNENEVMIQTNTKKNKKNLVNKPLLEPIIEEQICNKTKTKDVREEGLDKFYTIPSYSKKCIDKVFGLYDNSCWDLIVEPSAGNGSFFVQLDYDNKIGIDIAPENKNIIKMDFFNYTPPENHNNILVIGNPPFGRVSSTAIKFFNHSAKWSNVIAFIIPRTFRRPRVQNKLDKMFHLIHDEDVPNKPCCFSPKMTVKCCFQIWEKKEIERDIIDLPKKHEDWDFLSLGPTDDKGQPTPPHGADFALRAYGGKIGQIEKDKLNELRPKSWHWIKSNIDKDELINRFTQLDYSDSLNTARQNSMGQGELVRLYSNFKLD